MRFRLLIALAPALLLPVFASAQSFSGGLGSTDSFTISVNPQYPSSFSPVILSFLSSSLDLAASTLTVEASGKQIYKGSVKPVAVMLGKTGGVTTLKATITYKNIPYSKSVVLQPEDVSLIAEPLSSAPVLYPGKPLVPLSGNTRVVAVAHFVDAAGKTLDPSTLSYAWTVDGTRIANSSGIGKTAIIVASPLQYQNRTVSVTVQSPMGSLVSQDSLSLDPVNPVVRLYENDPLLGIRFDHALSGSYTINGTESSLYAAPFSLSLGSGAPVIQWFLNGVSAQTGSLITLRPTGKGEGNASLSLTAGTNPSALATTNLSLIFGAQVNTSFFGL